MELVLDGSPFFISDLMEIRVELAERAYDVVVRSGVRAEAGRLSRAVLPKTRACAVITDSTVGPLYAEEVLASLSAAEFLPTLITVPAGEASKSMSVVEEVCRQMIRAGLDRSAGVVALGGGVIGDLAGFCAAIYFRGIPYVQMPTTVVSLVDSAVGGKTGVNAPEGKNLLGAFYQPRLVIADPGTLVTLPPREYNEGFAEIIKHAAIRDASLLPLIRRVHEQGATHPELPDLIARNIKIKADIVAADEFETKGLRALLNFGHTIGHGIEASVGYGSLLHGEAISLGLLAALRLSEQHAGLPAEESAEIAELLRRYDLPTQLPAEISTADVMEKLQRDKKFASGAVRFVLLRRTGEAFVSHDLTLDHLRGAIDALRGCPHAALPHFSPLPPHEPG